MDKYFTDGDTRIIFGMYYLVTIIVVTKFSLLVSNIGFFTTRIPNQLETIGHNFDYTLNIFHPLSAIQLKADNKMFTVKKAIKYTNELYLFTTMQKGILSHEDN